MEIQQRHLACGFFEYPLLAGSSIYENVYLFLFQVHVGGRTLLMQQKIVFNTALSPGKLADLLRLRERQIRLMSDG